MSGGVCRAREGGGRADATRRTGGDDGRQSELEERKGRSVLMSALSLRFERGGSKRTGARGVNVRGLSSRSRAAQSGTTGGRLLVRDRERKKASTASRVGEMGEGREQHRLCSLGICEGVSEQTLAGRPYTDGQRSPSARPSLDQPFGRLHFSPLAPPSTSVTVDQGS